MYLVLFGTSSKTINFINTSNKLVLLAFNDDFMRFRKRTKKEIIQRGDAND